MLFFRSKSCSAGGECLPKAQSQSGPSERLTGGDSFDELLEDFALLLFQEEDGLCFALRREGDPVDQARGVWLDHHHQLVALELPARLDRRRLQRREAVALVQLCPRVVGHYGQAGVLETTAVVGRGVG